MVSYDFSAVCTAAAVAMVCAGIWIIIGIVPPALALVLLAPPPIRAAGFRVMNCVPS